MAIYWSVCNLNTEVFLKDFIILILKANHFN